MTQSINPPLRALVVGWPIKHSRSPMIHNYWLAQHGIDARYDKQAVEAAAFPEFLAALHGRGILGCNVTIPHKTTAYAAADRRLPDADAVGAANTLWFEKGKLCATNTDTDGFMTNLQSSSPQWRDREGPVAVFGAGGSTRAILFGLIRSGVDRIQLINRTRRAADELQTTFGKAIKVIDYDDRQRAIAGASCLINTTSLGMSGTASLDIDLCAMTANATVADIVYDPLETPLLKSARAAGHTPVDGLGMLLHQAAPAFEKWFGVRPKVTAELRALVVADLGAK